jgi:hypothetical protein
MIATLLNIRETAVESVDDATRNELPIAQDRFSSTSRLEEKALLRSLWQALKELSAEQRDVFCFCFEDDGGKDLFTILLEAQVVTLAELAQELGRPAETIVALWAKLPMDDDTIAAELSTKRTQVQKWRFRALQGLKKRLLR